MPTSPAGVATVVVPRVSLEDDILICANCGHFKRDHNKGLLKHQGRPEAHCAFDGFPCPCPGFEPLVGHPEDFSWRTLSAPH